MHRVLLPFLLAVAPVGAQSEAVAPIVAQVEQVLTGTWVGTLEYRDYSEPANSTKRVKLPTWLKIRSFGSELRFAYTYDDGPGKVVTENSIVRIDPSTARYNVVDSAGKITGSYAIAGLSELREGRGTLTLTGKGTENQVEVEARTTLRIGRNIVEITRETAIPGQAFAFRHAYLLVRATPPQAR